MKVHALYYFRSVIFVGAITLSAVCHGGENITEKQKYELTNAALAKEMQLKVWSPREVRILITQERFTELEDIFTALADNFKSDAAHEAPWIDSYNSFEEIADRDGSEQAFLPIFNKWVEETDSYISYSARGYFFLGLAFHSRGGAYISDTSEEQLVGMRNFRELVLADFATALKKKPDCVPAYMDLISAGMLTGDSELKLDALQRGLRYAPDSFWLRSIFLDSLSPSWGGSYQEMEQFISGFEEAAMHNPRLWSLRGMPDASRAKRLGGRHDYKEAVEYYTKALSYGDRLYWLRLRAYYSYKLRDYESVIADVNRVGTYGRGAKNIRYILENIEIEKKAGGEGPPRMRWGSLALHH
jgi:tetratricopeptide (TPR) repeat protein